MTWPTPTSVWGLVRADARQAAGRQATVRWRRPAYGSRMLRLPALLAFERSRVTRDADGNVSTIVLERRGWQRPDAVQGGGGGGTTELALPCDDHDLVVAPDGDVELRLRDSTPDSPVTTWMLRFGWQGERWLPVELVAPFELRLLFVPLRGRFVTTFEGWAFAGD